MGHSAGRVDAEFPVPAGDPGESRAAVVHRRGVRVCGREPVLGRDGDAPGRPGERDGFRVVAVDAARHRSATVDEVDAGHTRTGADAP